VCSFSSGWIDIRSVYRMDSLFPYSCISLQFFCLATCEFSRSGCQAVCATRLSACIDYLVRMLLAPRRDFVQTLFHIWGWYKAVLDDKCTLCQEPETVITHTGGNFELMGNYRLSKVDEFDALLES